MLLIILVLPTFRTPANFPPGPWGVPLLGVLPYLGDKPYVVLQQWWRKYGDIYSARFGSRLVIVINGVDLMKECFVRQGDTFTGRPWNYFKKITKNTGLVFSDGDVWREHRRFSLSCLRDFGMGKSALESKIHEEARYLLAEIDNMNGRPFSIGNVVFKAVANMICSVIYGSRFEYNDKVFQANIGALEQSARAQSLLAVVNFLPFLEFLPKLLPKDKMLSRNVKLRDSYAAYQIASHLDSLDLEHPRDFIDAYLSAMHRKLETKTKTTFAEPQLRRTIQDLFITGSETMNTTMKWVMLFMALHPEVQQKVQSEIDHVVGRSRLVSMRDKPQMPYTEATIMECQRLGNIALFSVPRCALADTTINGYDIPKGTWLFVNRWGTHASTKYWKMPSVFDPTRFLDENNVVRKPDAFVPFGMGTRSCIGESFAKMELFIFFSTILQSFTISLPEGATEPSLEPQMGINMPPQPYKVVANHR